MISALRAATWEQVERALLVSAREEQLERARVVRLDSTVTAALVHEPSDSSLLWDAVRVMVGWLRAASGLAGRAGLSWRDHRRLARKRARAIQFQTFEPMKRNNLQLALPGPVIDGTSRRHPPLDPTGRLMRDASNASGTMAARRHAGAVRRAS